MFGVKMRDKIFRFSVLSIGALSAIVLTFIVANHVLPIVMPFAVAWIVASVTVSPARRISRKIGVSEGPIRLIIALLLAISVSGVAGLFVWKIVDSVWQFLGDMGEGNRLYDLLVSLLSYEFPIVGDKIPEELVATVREAARQVLSFGFSSLAEGATAIATALPHVFLMLLVSLISLIYFSLDYLRINDFVKSLLPKTWISVLSTFKKEVFTVIRKYFLSYFFILIITFVVMISGFMILRVEHALFVAFLVAVLDLLPIIGVGTVLIPWSIIELISGNRFLGVGLLLLFVVNAIIRQLIEPKILGRNLDLHPIVTLLLIYVGYSLFGLVGLIILPLIAVTLGAVLKSNNTTEVN